jgi:V/A-type H+-transporting ATPase subunit E
LAESIEKLHNRILSDAKLKAAEIIRDAEDKAKRILDGARAQAQRDADEIISKASLEAESIRRSILSSRIRANRLRVLDEKNKIVQNVLKSVEEKLSDLASTNQFQPTLKRFVTEAVDAIGMDDVVVRVGFHNADRKSLESLALTLPQGTKFVVDEKPIDELGGVVASDAGGKMIFNNSFRARLERLDNQLLTTISSIIFGE